MLPQEANIGPEETTNINWEGAVNNIKTCVMPPLHCTALSRYKHTLGCSNLRGSSLTSGDLRCSFAPAHLYQMISSSTPNLLTLIPHSQSTSAPPTSCFLPSLLSYPSTFLLLLSISVSSQVYVGDFFLKGVQTEIGAEPSQSRGCAHVCSI